jgi:hypothetical protein
LNYLLIVIHRAGKLPIQIRLKVDTDLIDEIETSIITKAEFLTAPDRTIRKSKSGLIIPGETLNIEDIKRG